MTRLLVFWVLFSVVPSLALVPPEKAGQPPKTIYHFGPKALLLQDIGAGTIPQEAWDNAIMGDHTRFALPYFRRGLYGSSPALASVAYGDTLIGTGQAPWMMALTLSDSCRSPARTLEYSPYGIYAEPKFQAWAKRKGIDLSSVTDECFPVQKAGLAEADWTRAPIFPLYNQGRTLPPKYQFCEKLVSDFLDDEKIAIVADDGWESSWYVRDRSCIEHVEGTAEQVLSWMASDSQFWDPSKLGQPLSEETESDQPDVGTAYGVMLLNALLETHGFETAVPNRVLANLRRFPPKDSPFAFDIDVLGQVEACARNGKIAVLEQVAGQFLSELNDAKYASGEKLNAKMSQFGTDLGGLCR